MIMKKEYLTSKKGEPLKNCQDAYEINDEFFRYAVADGATREYFSAKLAQELVNRFCFDGDEVNKDIFKNEKYEAWLNPIQKKWLAYVEDIVENKKVNFVVKNRFNKQHSGASTFVGLELDRERLMFKAMIIGDSCLFHIRDKEIVECYLIDDYQEFDNSPDFFFSRDAILNDENSIEKREFTKPNIVAKNFENGDYFLLATDAISKWLLTQKHKGKWKEIWKGLLQEDKDWYDKLIENYREDKDNKLDDDDVTILILSTNDSSELIPFLDKPVEVHLKNTEEEKKEVDDIDSCLEKDMEFSSLVVDSSVEELKVESLEKEEKNNPIFLLMYKKSIQELEVFEPYLKQEAEKKGFLFVSQKNKLKIDKKYQKGIFLLDCTHFHGINTGMIEECFTYYKFSNKELSGYKYNEEYNSYVEEIEDFPYLDIRKTKKIPKILRDY